MSHADETKPCNIEIAKAPNFKSLAESGLRFLNPRDGPVDSNGSRPFKIDLETGARVGHSRGREVVSVRLLAESAEVVIANGDLQTVPVRFSHIEAEFLKGDLEPPSKYFPPSNPFQDSTPVASLILYEPAVSLKRLELILPQVAKTLDGNNTKFHAWLENAKRLPEATAGYTQNGTFAGGGYWLRVEIVDQQTQECMIRVGLRWKEYEYAQQQNRSPTRRRTQPATHPESKTER
jgi:hypothetical protein